MYDRDYLEIGPVPCDEDCLQLGTPEYTSEGARAECRRFIAAIRKVCGAEPEGAALVVKGNDHDFGRYYEVAVRYEVDNEAALAYAFKVEAEAPATWPEGV